MTPSRPVIGVTGNSGSGKGTVCAVLADMGGFCIDADKLAHQVMERGRPAYTEIADVFGPCVISPDGGIDREILGGIVFSDPVKRKRLERIVHAEVIRECLRLGDGAGGLNARAFVVWDAPLLAEAGMHRQCGMVLLVTAPYPVKLSRILMRDGITEERAKLRLSNQPSDGELYEKLTADIGKDRVRIIENNGSLVELEYKIQTLVIPGLTRDPLILPAAGDCGSGPQ